LLEKYGIETDCPPLFQLKPDCPASPDASAAGVAQATACEQDRCCLYIHRTGCLLSRGEILTCGMMSAKKAGDLASGPDFWSLWNGPVMQGLRRDLNTPDEWRQCRDCWFRQARYHAQRQERARRSVYALTRLASFSKKAWDFRGR
jgi:hypothetical protein